MLFFASNVQVGPQRNIATNYTNLLDADLFRIAYVVCRESEKLKVKSAKPQCKKQNCGGPSGEVSTLVFYWPAGEGGDYFVNLLQKWDGLVHDISSPFPHGNVYIDYQATGMGTTIILLSGGRIASKNHPTIQRFACGYLTDFRSNKQGFKHYKYWISEAQFVAVCSRLVG